MELPLNRDWQDADRMVGLGVSLARLASLDWFQKSRACLIVESSGLKQLDRNGAEKAAGSGRRRSVSEAPCSKARDNCCPT